MLPTGIYFLVAHLIHAYHVVSIHLGFLAMPNYWLLYILHAKARLKFAFAVIL